MVYITESKSIYLGFVLLFAAVILLQSYTHWYLGFFQALYAGTTSGGTQGNIYSARDQNQICLQSKCPALSLKLVR